MGDTALKVVDPLARPLRRGRSASSGPPARRSRPATTAGPRRPPPSSPPTAGSRPATSPGSTKTDTSTSSTALKDMINVGGEKVYPRDVEEVLHRHPAVADAVVIGVPDPDLGEVGQGVRRPQAGPACTAAELIDFLRPVLAAFKVPARSSSSRRSPGARRARRCGGSCGEWAGRDSVGRVEFGRGLEFTRPHVSTGDPQWRTPRNGRRARGPWPTSTTGNRCSARGRRERQGLPRLPRERPARGPRVLAAAMVAGTLRSRHTVTASAVERERFVIMSESYRGGSLWDHLPSFS